MNPQKKLNQIRKRRERRARACIRSAARQPRLSVFRSNRYTYAQLIDDENQKTLLSASTREIKDKASKKELAYKLGELLAKKATKAGIGKAVFDRGSYKYHGRVKEVAEGARKSGLTI